MESVKDRLRDGISGVFGRFGWVKDTVRSRVPAWGVVVITAAAVGAASASVAVMALGRATNQNDELVVQSEVKNEG